MKPSICAIIMMYLRSWGRTTKEKDDDIAESESDISANEFILYQDFINDSDEGPIWF